MPARTVAALFLLRHVLVSVGEFHEECILASDSLCRASISMPGAANEHDDGMLRMMP